MQLFLPMHSHLCSELNMFQMNKSNAQGYPVTDFTYSLIPFLLFGLIKMGPY